MSRAEYVLRQAEESDVPFIFNSWLKSYRDGWTVKSVPNNIYYRHHHQAIEDVLNKPLATVLVAHSPDDRDQIFGFAVVEYLNQAAIVHYVYVKYPFRGWGLARDMVALLIRDLKEVYYTHKTRRIDMMSAKLSERNFIYNPYLF